MFRREFKGQGFTDHFYQFGDIEYIFRLLEQGDLYYISDVLCQFRCHDDSCSRKNLEGLLVVSDAVRLARMYPDSFLCEYGLSQEQLLEMAVDHISLFSLPHGRDVFQIDFEGSSVGQELVQSKHQREVKEFIVRAGNRIRGLYERAAELNGGVEKDGTRDHFVAGEDHDHWRGKRLPAWAVKGRQTSPSEAVCKPDMSTLEPGELLFDSSYYARNNPDVVSSGMGLREHFANIGWREGRDPHPLFSVSHYLNNCLELRSGDVDPLTHFIETGARKKYSPHPLFDTAFYCSQLAPSAAPESNPLIHYLIFGAFEKLNPHPLFDSQFYLDRNDDVAASGLSPLAHYVTFGARERRDPHPLFDAAFYLEQYDEDAAERIDDPLRHFLAFGAGAKKDPHRLFDTSWYLERYPDVRSAKMNPLEHFCRFGAAEARQPRRNFLLDDFLTESEIPRNDPSAILRAMNDFAAEFASLNTELPESDIEFLVELHNSPNFRFVKTYPPGHYYSPLPDSEEIARNKAVIPITEPSGLDVKDVRQLRLAKQLASYYSEQPFPHQKTDDRRFYLDNNWCSYGDPLVLYMMMRHMQPKRIIEVGSGFSSAAMLDTNELFFEDQIGFTFIDPDSNRLDTLLTRNDFQRKTIIRDPVQRVPLKRFEALQANDILFIDSSHVVKLGSDVSHLLFSVLPRLNKGVLVHFHDVLWPFKYPQIWLESGFAWNEAYFLRSFLQFNNSFEIVYWNSYMEKHHATFLEANMPLVLQHPTEKITQGNSSLWIRKIR
jgi:predicted O-methyltransferase YrrM